MKNLILFNQKKSIIIIRGNTSFIKKIVLVIFMLNTLFYIKGVAQEQGKSFSTAIEDNSFLIEEAYNQEAGVVQHISIGDFLWEDNQFFYTFTQEWPISGIKHQFSYDIPYSFLGNRNGLGDISINYRYQLFYKENWASISPRFSVILPTGNNDDGFGDGVYGTQINIPVSKRISESFAIHFNLGSTYLHQIEYKHPVSTEIFIKNIFNFNVGGSIIWLSTQNLNLMLEWTTDFIGEFNVTGNIERTTETIINPGIRYAIDVNKLQIVPGLSLPIIVGNDVKAFAFFYLSFEHPFRKL